MRKLNLLLVLMGIGLLLFGDLTFLSIIPQPAHVAALEGTAFGAFCDLPNWVVGLLAMGIGVGVIYFADLFESIEKTLANDSHWARP